MDTSEHTENTELRGNTSNPRSRKWVVTLNNWTEEEYKSMKGYFSTQKHWIIGKENQGTPHLQAFFESKNAVGFNTLKKLLPRAHIEKAKGDHLENLAYCSKEGDYETNISPPLNERLLTKYNNTVWKPWQQEILDILTKEPDSRTIHCVVDTVGNSGKSYLCKYIDLKYDVILASGKKDDIFNQVKLYMEQAKEPKIVLLDVPRSQQGFISWGAIEALKNGHLYSGKYEGGKLIFDNVHVVIFMNSAPPTYELSNDRWKIHHI